VRSSSSLQLSALLFCFYLRSASFPARKMIASKVPGQKVSGISFPVPSSQLAVPSLNLGSFLRVWPAGCLANLSTVGYHLCTDTSLFFSFTPLSPTRSPLSTLCGFFIEFVSQQIALDTWLRLWHALRSCKFTSLCCSCKSKLNYILHMLS